MDQDFQTLEYFCFSFFSQYYNYTGIWPILHSNFIIATDQQRKFMCFQTVSSEKVT